MNILVITKRHYTNKDLIKDRFGRLWELPVCFLNNGHNIKGICLSYRKCDNEKITLYHNNNYLEWNSFTLFPFLFNYIGFLITQFKSFNPNIIWASSDCFHVILGWVLGKIFGIPCVIDLYDNYEAFSLSKFTGIIPLFQTIVKNADAVSVVSEPLKELIENFYHAKGKLCIIENAVDTDDFFPRNKLKSRKLFDFPENAKIIGTAGALDEGRGISVLYEAFNSLSKCYPNLYLAVAGIGSRNHQIYNHPHIIDLGVLPHTEVPFFFNALDVAVICNKDSAFGKYCYPQKAHEIIACKIPLVAAKVGVMKVLLKNNPTCLYDPLNPIDLAKKIIVQLEKPIKLKIQINTWKNSMVRLEKLMETTIVNYRQ